MTTQELRNGARMQAGRAGRRTRAALVTGLLVSTTFVACGDDPIEPVDHESHPVASITLSQADLDLAIGQNATLTVTAMCAHEVVIHPTITWASQDASVAAVDANGTVTAVAYGSVTITAAAGTADAHAHVDVAPAGTVVGVAGGVVGSADGALTLEIPAGALAVSTDIVVERLPDDAFMADPLYVRGSAWRIRPEGLELALEARLRLRFQEQSVPTGVPLERLRVHERERTQDQDRWRETEENQVRLQQREVEASVARLGVFALVPSHTGQFGPEGGVITSADGRATLEIPAGALTQSTYMQMHRLGDDAFPADPLYVRGTLYELWPDALQLQERARLMIHYDPDAVPDGVLHDRLRIQERDRDQDRWREAQQNQVRTQERIVEARLDRFGVFAVVASNGATVGTAGGLVTSADGEASLEVPAGALEDDVFITLTRVDDALFSADPLYVLGTAWEVQPDGLQFRERAWLRIHYDPAHVPDGVLHERLRIREHDSDQGGWRETRQHRLRHQEHIVEAELEHLSIYAVLALDDAAIPVAWVTVDPSSLALPPGSTGRITATAFDADGFVVNRSFTWSTSNEAVASVDESGLVSALAAGTATITAEADGKSATAGVVVNPTTPPPPPPPPATVSSVTLTPATASVAIGGTVQFGAVARDAAGNVLSRTFMWTSGNATVATVGPNGLATAVDAGSVTITATADGVAGTATLTVTAVPAEVATVTVAPATLSLPEGGTGQLTATAFDVDGNQLSRSFAWSSGDVGVATVGGTGVVTAVSGGATTVTATADGVSGTASVTVVPEDPSVASVTVTPATLSLPEGGSGEFVAVARDADGNVLARSFTWDSDDEAVATVTADGLVAAVAEGSTTITATADGVSGTATVVVEAPEPAVASVTITPATLSVAVGGTRQLAAVARDADGVILSRSFAWSSDDEGVAAVDATGLLTAVAEGSATVTATTDGVAGTAAVTVTAAVGSVVIEPIGNEPLEVGYTLQLEAAAYDPQGVVLDVPLTWTSSDDAIVTVDDDGLVTGTGRGTATVTAAAGGASDAVEVRVVGESGTYGNNLSWPVVFADGIGLSGEPVATSAGVRPLASEGVVVDALPFFWEGNDPTYGIYYEQLTFNTWQAEWVDGTGQSPFATQVTWGDNLTHQTWSASRPIRVEQVLSATALTLTGYTMTYLYGQGPQEMQGTDGSTASFVPTVYTVGPTLRIEKIDGQGGSPVATVTEQAVGSEVNIAGKVIYGFNLRLSDWTPPAGETLAGWYRITFELASGANLSLDSVGNSGDELLYVPVVDGTGRRSWLDIYVNP